MTCMTCNRRKVQLKIEYLSIHFYIIAQSDLEAYPKPKVLVQHETNSFRI